MQKQTPRFSLSKMIALVQRMKLGEFPVHSLEFHKIAGFFNNHGASYETLTSLKNYGIISDTPGGYLHLSKDIIKIRGEKLPELIECARTPPIFRQLINDSISEKNKVTEILKSLGWSDFMVASRRSAYLETIRYLKEVEYIDRNKN